MSMNASARSILSLSWQSVAYGLGVVGSRIIVYLMLPVLTRYMSRVDYGAVSVITALYAFLNTLTNAGLPSATFRFYNDNSDKESQRLTLGASQFLFFCYAAIPAAVIIIFPDAISASLLGSADYALALQFAAAFLVADSMNFFGTIILRIQVRPLMASVQGIVLVACETGMAIFFVVFRHMGVAGYWLGFLIGEIIGLAFTVWLVRKSLVFQIAWAKVWDLTKFGIPLIPASLSMTALRLADRYIIGSIAGLASVAVYDVGYKLGSLVTPLIITPFQAAWPPFAFSIAHKPDAPRIYRNVLTYLAAGCSFVILGITAFRVALVHIVAPVSYADANQVLGWVAASQLFLAVFLVLSLGPMLANRTSRLLWPSVSAAGLNVLLDFLLVPMIGILGAAIATFVSYLVLAVFTYFVGRRSFEIPVDWNRLGRLLLVDGAIVLAILAAENVSSVPLQFMLKIMALIAFPVLLLLVGFVSPAQGIALWNGGWQLISRKFAR